MDKKDDQEPLGTPSIDASALTIIIGEYRPDLSLYECFYRDTHQDPELSGLESRTSHTVAQHLKRLGFEVHTNIGGHGVAGVLRNGPGRKVLIRAELDALPILELTDLPYKSTKLMVDRYGNKRPVMHACGHDMHMAALLAASELLKRSSHKWTGTLITLFQPDEEETGGARAMVEDGLYDKIPLPDILLGQHLVPLLSGKVAIRPGQVLNSADSFNVRIIGEPCENSLNPQMCVDPIPLAMRIITILQEKIPPAVAPEDATIACWGFHAGIPGNDYVASADFLLDIKAWKPHIRRRVLDMVTEIIKAECKAAKTPKDPVIDISVRAPLTSNHGQITTTIQRAFQSYFGSSLVEMPMTRSCEDFPTLGAKHEIPYAYWNFGGSPNVTGEVPINHSPYFAPDIQPTLKVGTDAMALAVLSFLAS